MKTVKQLQIAAAVASLFGVGLAHSATVISSGSTVAAETVFKTGTIGENTRVRAPSVTYKYDGGVNGADTVQRFAISLNLGGGTPAAFATAVDTTDPLSTNTNITSGILARTIQAFATVRGVTGRIPVLAPGDAPTLGGAPTTTAFYIVLDSVARGQLISPATGPQNTTATDQALTFKFSLVNPTGVGVNLDQLELQFNTQKAASNGALTNFGGVFAADDQPTDNTPTGNLSRDRWIWLWKLNTLSADTAGRTATSCVEEPAGRISLTVMSGINEPPIFSSEETQNNGGAIGGNSRVTVENYLNFSRALSVVLAKDADRIIQTTNSFPTNLNANPTNGIGGTGGGRFTFKPSSPAVYSTNFGASNMANGTANVIGGNPTVTGGTAGMTLATPSSGDERDAKIGTITFSNRANIRAVLDRILDTDNFAFKAEVPTGAVNVRADSSNLASGAGANGDFTTVTVVQGGAPGNVFGGVDIGDRAATPEGRALTIEFDSKAAYAGFAPTSQLILVKGTTCVGAAAQPGAIAIFPNAVTLPGIGGATAPLAQRYRWSIPATQLAALAGGATLAGTYQVCYSVPGTTPIPTNYFRNVIVTLNKDDITEQSNTSCQANWAEIYGGVKVDVRNWVVSVPGDDTWSGVTRIINNSETDTATVEGQFIHPDTGAYGAWGAIAAGANAAEATALNALVPALKPRAVAYLFNSAIAGKLVNPSSAPGADNSSVLAAASKGPGRLRVSADVSTIRVQSYIFNSKNNAFTEASASQGADFVNVDSSNRDHIDQDAQRDIVK